MRERGLKFVKNNMDYAKRAVAPVRERGLKLNFRLVVIKKLQSRSREGAWIEICQYCYSFYPRGSRSREGAWIEM